MTRRGTVSAGRGVMRSLTVAVALSMVALTAACSGSATTDSTGEKPGGTASGTTPPGTAPAGCTSVETRLTPPDTMLTLTSSGIERSYYLHLPADHDPAKPRPLPVIFSWHGSGSAAIQQVAYSQLPSRAPARGFVVVTPEGTGTPRGWNMFKKADAADDYAFFEDLLRDVRRFVCVDDHRVYSTGISNGSAFTAFLACTTPFRLAAVAMVAATVPPVCGDGTPKISAMAFHGVKDAIVPYGGGSVESETGQSDGIAAPGAEGVMESWARYDGCDAPPVRTLLPAGSAAPTAQRTDFPGCSDGTEVVFFRLDDGGHTWPGSLDLEAMGITYLGPMNRDVDATGLMLDFFERHPRP